MKISFKNIKWTVAAAAALALSVAMTSCSDQPDEFKHTDGVPSISYIRPTLPSQADSLITSASLESILCIVGDNLRSVHEIWFNDQKASLNTSYMTDHTIIVMIPSAIPELVTNKIYFKTSDGQTVDYDFNVVVPGPVVSEMSLEWSNPGDEVTIYGNYFVDDPNVPITISVAGVEVPYEDITSIAKNQVSFIIPQGAEEGTIKVSTIYGKTESTLRYRDSRGMLLNFDNERIGQGWKIGTLMNDEWSIDGNYLQLGTGTSELDENANWNEDFAFHNWAGSWDTPQNMSSGTGMALNKLADFSNYENMALKFEMCIPADYSWSSGTMQICFEGYDKVTLSGNPIDGYDGPIASANHFVFNGDDPALAEWGRAMYRPWATTGSFNTANKWITVTIPLKNFNYNLDGIPTNSVPSSAADFASLSFFVIQGGVAGTPCTPVFKFDNFRAVVY